MIIEIFLLDNFVRGYLQNNVSKLLDFFIAFLAIFSISCHYSIREDTR